MLYARLVKEASPRPWRVDGSVNYRQGVKEPIIACGDADTFSPLLADVLSDGGRLPGYANAELIVLAANSHEALVDALTQIQNDLHWARVNQALERVRIALAIATGGL